MRAFAGIYHSEHDCFAVRELVVDGHTSLKGQSYTRVSSGPSTTETPGGARYAASVSSGAEKRGGSAPAVTRLEVSLPVLQRVAGSIV